MDSFILIDGMALWFILICAVLFFVIALFSTIMLFNKNCDYKNEIFRLKAIIAKNHQENYLEKYTEQYKKGDMNNGRK